MVDRFNCLRHYTVISSYYDNRHVCYFRTACTHRCKRSMPRCIKEGNLFTVYLYLVGTDMLCNTACLASRYFRVTDGIKQCCFTMVNVPHDCNNRWTLFQFIFIYFRLFEVCFKVCNIHTYFFFYLYPVVSTD